MKTCKYCGNQLLPKQNLFCSQSCAAKYNNPTSKKKPPKLCKQCGKELVNRASIFCNLGCFNEYQYQTKILPLFYAGKIAMNATLRKILIHLFGDKCQECGTGNVWNGKSLTMEVHHVDNNSDNNMPDNVRLLCPNCHSQYETDHTKKHTRRNKYLRKYKGYE